ERLDDQCLAGARLTRDDRQPRTEEQIEVGDDAEVDDVQLGQHRAAALPVREAELGLQDLVEVPWREGDDPRRPRASRARDRVAAGELTDLPAVGGEHDRTVVAYA